MPITGGNNYKNLLLRAGCGGAHFNPSTPETEAGRAL